MSFVLKLPFIFFLFWFIEAPKQIILCFQSINIAFLQLFSLPILVKTFFKPIKNEYRKGLVGFSIGMGMGVKSVLIGVNLVMLIALIMIECVIVVLFMSIPIITGALLFI